MLERPGSHGVYLWLSSTFSGVFVAFADQNILFCVMLVLG